MQYGWHRWTGIGCSVVIILLLGVLFGGAFSTDGLLALGLTAQAERTVRAMPADTPRDMALALQRGFRCVVQAAGQDALDEEQIAPLGEACKRALADDKVSLEEAAEIRRILVDLCRVASEAGAERRR